MRIRAVLLALCTIVLALALVLVPAAQPTRAQGEMVVCDSTTVLLLYIAEHDYGFHSMMDVSVIEKGQYAPLFEAMMAMMESMDETPESMMESTAEAMMGEEMMGDMMMLTPAVIEGEPEICTSLRAEIEAYLYGALSAEMMSME